MLITKHEEVTKQGICKKYSEENSVLREVSYLFIHSSGWGGGEHLFEFDWEEEGVGVYLRLGAY